MCASFHGAGGAVAPPAQCTVRLLSGDLGDVAGQGIRQAQSQAC